MDPTHPSPLRGFDHRGGQIETCEECRFDGGAYTDEDVFGSLMCLGAWFREFTFGLTGEQVAERQRADVWSIAEYARHTMGELWSMADLSGLASMSPGLAIKGGWLATASDEDATSMIDLQHEFERIEEEATRLAKVLVCQARPDYAEIDVKGRACDVEGLARHGLHEALHHLQDIGRIRSDLGLGTPSQSGVVEVVSSSKGGVPKGGVLTAAVGYRGLEGDRQKTRKHHGRVWQAVCLWSSDVIDALAAEGHPITPGSCGENITISGIDWSSLVLGTRIRIGGRTGLLMELTDWATPCSKIGGSFIGRDFNRVNVASHRGWSRAYAKVLEDGPVTMGDPVWVETPAVL